MNNDAAVSKSKVQVSATDRLINIATYLLFAFFSFICTFPFYYILINTFSANDLSAKGEILFYPKGIHFQNYIDVFKIPGLWDATVISAGRTVIGTVLTVTASAFLGFMFTQEDIWARKFWYRFTIITMYFNAGIIPWYLTMKSLNLTNNFMVYILPAIVSPFFIILVKTFNEGTARPAIINESSDKLRKIYQTDNTNIVPDIWYQTRPYTGDATPSSEKIGGVWQTSALSSPVLADAIKSRSARIFFAPADHHSQNFLSPETTSDVIKFFEQIMGYNNGELTDKNTVPIDAKNSIFLWVKYLTALQWLRCFWD